MEYYRSEIAELKRQLAAASSQTRGPAIKTLSDESSDDDDTGAGGDGEVGGGGLSEERLAELNARRVQHEEDVQRLQMERTKLQSQISNMCVSSQLRFSSLASVLLMPFPHSLSLAGPASS